MNWVAYEAEGDTVVSWALVDENGDVQQVTRTPPADYIQPNMPQWYATENGGMSYGVPGQQMYYEFIPARSVAGFDVDTILAYRGAGSVPYDVRAAFPGAVVRDFLTDPAFVYGRTDDFMAKFGDYLPYITAAWAAAVIIPWAAAAAGVVESAASGAGAGVTDYGAQAAYNAAAEADALVQISLPEAITETALPALTDLAPSVAQVAAEPATVAAAETVAAQTIPSQAAAAALPASITPAQVPSVLGTIKAALPAASTMQKAVGVLTALYPLASKLIGGGAATYPLATGAPGTYGAAVQRYAPGGMEQWAVDSGTPGVLANLSLIAKEFAIPGLILGAAYLLSRR